MSPTKHSHLETYATMQYNLIPLTKMLLQATGVAVRLNGRVPKEHRSTLLFSSYIWDTLIRHGNWGQLHPPTHRTTKRSRLHKNGEKFDRNSTKCVINNN